MALIKTFIAREGSAEEDSPLRDREQILAYLEELFRVRTVLTTRLEASSDLTFAARVEQVNELKNTFTISLENRPRQEPKVGTLIHFLFALDGLRFTAQARFLGRCGYLQSEFALPEAIHRAERRSEPRLRFSRRENLRALVHERLTDDLAVSGPIINLGQDGLCLRVDRVVDTRHDRRLKPRLELFSHDAALPLVRLQNLPQSPDLECQGILRHAEVRGERIYLGLELSALGAAEYQALSSVLAQKDRSPAPRFPFKRRRGEIDAIPELCDEEVDEPEPAPEDLEPIPTSDSEAEGKEPDQIAAPIDRKALLRRRARQVLLVVSDDLERAMLKGTLFVDGYRNIHEASGLGEALGIARQHRLDAIILDQQIGIHSALGIVHHLRVAGLLDPARVVVLKSREDIKLKVAEKGGAIHLTVPHPVDFDGVLKPELERLLGLSDQA